SLDSPVIIEVVDPAPKKPETTPVPESAPAPRASTPPPAQAAVPAPPVDPEPVDPEPVDPGPVDPGPVDPGPVDPGPVDPGPVDPGPVDPGPEISWGTVRVWLDAQGHTHLSIPITGTPGTTVQVWMDDVPARGAEIVLDEAGAGVADIRPNGTQLLRNAPVAFRYAGGDWLTRTTLWELGASSLGTPNDGAPETTPEPQPSTPATAPDTEEPAAPELPLAVPTPTTVVEETAAPADTEKPAPVEEPAPTTSVTPAATGTE
ncbi:MAG: hypothetical protein WA971_12885, partial [Microbacterium sp.]